MCVEWACGGRQRAGGGSKGGGRGGDKECGETSQAAETGLRTLLELWRMSRGDLRFSAVSVIPNPVLPERTQGNGGRGSGRIQNPKHPSLCLSKEKFNWNCLIFKRNVQDLSIL